jgi:hypothetical protein
MNKKDQIRNIEKSAVFILSDSEYKELVRMLTFGKYNKARLFIEEIIEMNEIDMALNPEDETFVIECKNLNNLEDLIIDLIVNDEENVERKQFEQYIK